MARIKASVILPTYDEAGNIIELVEELRKNFSKSKITNEIIVVDDDSPDQTGILARKYFSKVPRVRVVIRKREKGLATAIRRGIETAVGEIIVVMDTDFNHSPRLVPRLVKKCEKFDIAVGSRFVKGGGMANKTRELLSRIYNIFLIKPLMGSPVKDNLCGFYAVKFNRLNGLDFNKIFFGYGDYFIRLIYYAKKKGFTFVELPSFYKERTYGVSKSRFVQMFADYFLTALKLRIENDK